MYIFEIIKISYTSIFANKVRATLTTLGILIGISAVIAMLSIGQGAQSSILEQVQGLGANTVTVVPIAGFGGFGSRDSLRAIFNNKLDRGALAKISNPITFREVLAIAPEISDSFEVTFNAASTNTTIYAVDNNYFPVRETAADKGRVISETDAQRGRKVAVLGSETAVDLFKDSDPVGKEIKISSTRYTVIGVAESKGTSVDDRIYIPIKAADSIIDIKRGFSQVTLKVGEESAVDSVANKVETELREYFKVTDPDKQGFTVYTSQDLLTLTSSITGIFTTLLSSIAGISLVVGGIGIMNIMLVSVTERTKEIGLRKAVGAKQSAILLQFLTEAILLSLLGGFLGIVLGIGFGLIVGALGNIPVIISPAAIALATSVSIFIGVVFGFYPAYRASQLNPIDALRYD